MICAGCVASLPYLQFYSGLAVSKVEKEDVGADAAVSVEKGEGEKETEDKVEPLAKSGVDILTDATKSSFDPVCPLTKTSPDIPLTSSLFLPMSWRSALCNCSSCSKLYLDTKTTFLTQETDTVHHYESQVLVF